jgi:hypothetical protein
MQADNAEAEADKTARAEDRTRWMDGLLDEAITQRCEMSAINIRHVLLFCILIYVTVWAFFGWAGLGIFLMVCVGGVFISLMATMIRG